MIERRFHQIWINNEKPELPDELKRLRDTWLKYHPSWDYSLWDLQNLDFEPRCSSLLPMCQHPAQAADLLRMEILFHHGGIYMDTDFECLKPLDRILEDVVAFSCSEEGRCISIGILGAEKGSRLFSAVIENFPRTIGVRPVNVETGPAFFTEVLFRTGISNDFTIFPTHYFYPFNVHTKKRDGIDLSKSYAVHHYSESWKKPPTKWRKVVNKVKSIF